MSFRGYRGLTVWNRSVDLVEMTYGLTDELKGEAPAEILAEMRRCVLAIPSHLAAGYQTPSADNYLRHVHAVQVILSRFETLVTILERLEWAKGAVLNDLKSMLIHIAQLLHCLERYLSSKRCEPAVKSA